MTSQPDHPRTRPAQRGGRRRRGAGVPADLVVVLVTVVALTAASATSALDGLPAALRDTLGAAVAMLADS